MATIPWLRRRCVLQALPHVSTYFQQGIKQNRDVSGRDYSGDYDNAALVLLRANGILASTKQVHRCPFFYFPKRHPRTGSERSGEMLDASWADLGREGVLQRLFGVSRGTFPILSRDPSFQKTSGNPGKTAGLWKERRLKRMGNQLLERCKKDTIWH